VEEEDEKVLRREERMVVLERESENRFWEREKFRSNF